MSYLPFAQARSALSADITQRGGPVWSHPRDAALSPSREETRVAPAKNRAKEKEAGCLFCVAPVRPVSVGGSGTLRLHVCSTRACSSTAGLQEPLLSLPHRLCLLTPCSDP